MDIPLQIVNQELCNNTLHEHTEIAEIVQKRASSRLSARRLLDLSVGGASGTQRSCDQSALSFISHNLDLIHLNVRKRLKGAAERCNKCIGLSPVICGTVCAFFLLSRCYM